MIEAEDVLRSAPCNWTSATSSDCSNLSGYTCYEAIKKIYMKVYSMRYIDPLPRDAIFILVVK